MFKWKIYWKCNTFTFCNALIKLFKHFCIVYAKKYVSLLFFCVHTSLLKEMCILSSKNLSQITVSICIKNQNLSMHWMIYCHKWPYGIISKSINCEEALSIFWRSEITNQAETDTLKIGYSIWNNCYSKQFSDSFPSFRMDQIRGELTDEECRTIYDDLLLQSNNGKLKKE